jgi:hypothetical protein
MLFLLSKIKVDMKKVLLAVAALMISAMIFAKTPPGSFKYTERSAQTLSQAAVSTYISKLDLENYRLRDRSTTLTFDNGFDIILLPAVEAQAKGFITNATAYQQAFDKGFKLPVFHMTPDGRVSAAYSPGNSKYSTEKR